jgi:hypothetical protein
MGKILQFHKTSIVEVKDGGYCGGGEYAGLGYGGDALTDCGLGAGYDCHLGAGYDDGGGTGIPNSGGGSGIIYRPEPMGIPGSGGGGR